MVKKNKFVKTITAPFRAYVRYIKHSIVPKPYSHQVKMNINIKKGQQSGNALIPCTIYAMDHSIDMNPALIRKKDKKVMKYYKPGQKIKYNSNNYTVELTKEEKEQGYVLRELERCKHCGQKLVIAEVEQTRYRSCPSINVKLGDKAKQDLVVPVQFGVNKADITSSYFVVPIFLSIIVLGTLSLLGINWTKYLTFALDKIPNVTFSAGASSVITIVVTALFLGFLWLYMVPLMLYKNIKLLQWYYQVKPTMKKSPYKVK